VPDDELVVEPVVPVPDVLEPVPLPVWLPVPVVPVVLLPGVVLALPLTEPVPVAPIEDVEPVLGVVLLVVVSVLLLVLPVVVLGVVALPLRLPEPVVLPVVVDGAVELDELLAPVPVVPALSLRWHAPSDRAATTVRVAAATWVRVVFIRKLLEMGCANANGKGSPDCPEVTLGG